jgi:hypothetical protein
LFFRIRRYSGRTCSPINYNGMTHRSVIPREVKNGKRNINTPRNYADRADP